MKVAFYAPLKPADHPVPSGDRRMARAFFSLLQALGHEVELTSRFRSLERCGDEARQARLARLGRRIADRLIERRGWQWEMWFTYHNHYRAPDHLGPAVSRALGIPYVIAEPSIAGKRQHGPWAQGHEAALHAVRSADRLLAMSEVDARNLTKWIDEPARVLRFQPFLETWPGSTVHRRDVAERYGLGLDSIWCLTVAMMRDDIKLASYRLLAEALEHLRPEGWQLLVAGDGEAAATVSRLLSRACGNSVVFAGRLDPHELAALYATADLYLWPSLGEAYGTALLEALAHGLPVVACREGGVPDLITSEENGLLIDSRSSQAYAEAVERVLGDDDLRRQLGAQAALRFRRDHSFEAARSRLKAVLGDVLTERRSH